MSTDKKVFGWCGAFILLLVLVTGVFTQFAAAQGQAQGVFVAASAHSGEAVANLQGSPLATKIKRHR